MLLAKWTISKHKEAIKSVNVVKEIMITATKEVEKPLLASGSISVAMTGKEAKVLHADLRKDPREGVLEGISLRLAGEGSVN